MKNWLNLPWWQDKTRLEKANGQYVLNVEGAVGRKPISKINIPSSTNRSGAVSVKATNSSARNSMRNGPPENLQPEFQIRDPLVNQPLDGVIACPDCSSRPVFNRQTCFNGSYEYRVQCRWHSANFCENPCACRMTPWLASLELAVRHWTLSIKLAK